MVLPPEVGALSRELLDIWTGGFPPTCRCFDVRISVICRFGDAVTDAAAGGQDDLI